MVAHPGFESNELQNHFHGEDSSEDHVEDVHDVIEERRLAVVLQGRRGEEKLTSEASKRQVQHLHVSIIIIIIPHLFCRLCSSMVQIITHTHTHV